MAHRYTRDVRHDGLGKYLALAFLWLVLTGCGCASVNPHWNEAPPDVRVSGWQFFSPRDYPEELATWH